ncbi:EF-hand calcium-binding domain-containing protein 5-like isoform X1 [Asterias rubens]|uniref:EF-hand calcium-binding domain-containing protein 5-like isoform X1 n=1 Tax=Asterias rubens TaxID=7604 RepID=UPI001454F504|nr:EF-hand calcium-binding domain-containing protein 5-like isoform X1 [Asterias rubens]
MADIQTVSPNPGSAGMSRRMYSDPRPPSQGGSRPSSRVGFQVSERTSPRPNSRQGSSSGGRIPHPPSTRPSDGAISPLHERPPSVRSLRQKTEMSEFLAPMVKTAVRRWKRFHEQRVREKYLQRKEEKRLRVHTAKEEKQRLARRIPIDSLAMEWLNENNVTVDARAYLLDKLLPTLILGIEKLLLEAEKKGLTEKNEASPNFNPVNFLAQYLMRNNPRYSNFPEASPYIRGLREVTEELKKYVFSFEDNRLAKIKADARRRREEQERQAGLRNQERLQRSARLRQNYQEWLIDDDGMIEIQVLQTAVQSFAEVLRGLPEDIQKAAHLTEMFAKREAPAGKVGAEEFVQYLKQYITNMTPDLFNELIQHLSRCGAAYRMAAILEARRDVLSHLFNDCDHAGVGVIDRHRVLGLFEYFWDNQPWAVKRYLQNPRKWPMLELDEVSDDLDSISEGSVATPSIPGTPHIKTRQPPTVSEKAEPKTEAGTVEPGPDDVVTATGEILNIGAPATGDTEATVKASEDVVGEPEVKVEEPSAEQSKPDNQEAVEPSKEPEEQESKPEGQVVEQAAEDTTSKPEAAEQELKPEGEVVDQAAQEADSKPEDKPAEQEVEKTTESSDKESTEQASEKVEQVAEKSDAPSEESVKELSAEPSSEPAEESPAKPVEEPSDKPVEEPSDKPVEEPSDKPVEEPADKPVEESSTKPEEEQLTKPVEEQESSGEPATKPIEEPSSEPQDEPAQEQSPEKVETVAAEPEVIPAVEVTKVAQESAEATADETQKEKHSSEEKPSAEQPHIVEQTPAPTKETVPEAKPEETIDEPATAVSDKQSAKTVAVSASKSPTKTPTFHRAGSVATSMFDENLLNCSQFVQLVESFLGMSTPEEVVQHVIKYLGEGYVETEEEKYLRLQKARHEAQSAKRKLILEQLFEKWDNDGSGYLDLEELHSVMSKFKENMESKIMQKAKAIMQKEDYDNRLSKRDFKAYIEAVCTMLPGGEDNFDPLIEFLMTSIERSYEERIRGQARKKWLSMIISSAHTSGASLQPVYKCVFNSLYKDAEQHGRGKRISANISMLERNDSYPTRGPTCLRYVASTPDDAHFMLTKVLYRDQKGISFTSIDSGKPIHVPRVQNHGNIMFWNPERSDEKFKKLSVDEYDPTRDRQGSFIVIPLKDHRKRVFGVMGIDTLNDPQEKSIFITHEISFFQGVAKSFSAAHQYVDIRKKTLRITESALAWIHRRSPSVLEINVYIVEPDEQIEDIVLRRMMTTDRNGNITVHENPSRLERKENLFRDYLFKCVDNSDTVTADAYGQRHTAFPLRDPDGRAVALIDLSIGDLKQLAGHENKEVQRMLKLLQAAHREVSMESEGGDRTIVLEAEKGSEESRIDIMFDRIMLTDLRETVGKLNTRAFAELKSYKDPPKVIHDILVSVLTLFFQDKSDEGELESWNTCKQYVNQELIRKIEEFDPTASEAVGAVSKIASRLKDVPHGAVAKHGSLPAQNLYNWAFVCLSLLEHTSKMQQTHKPSIITPPASAEKFEGALEM